MPKAQRTPDLVGRNIDGVLRLEEHAVRRRSTAASLASRVGHFAGTLPFVLLHVVLITAWIAHNRGAGAFDPYPFNLLSTVASCEAVLLTAFVLMKQDHESKLSDRRDHLDLQVNLITEQEASLIIQMLERISHKLEVPQNDVTDAALHLSRTATLEHLVEQLRVRWPDGEH